MVVNIVKRAGGVYVNDSKSTPLTNPSGNFFSPNDEGGYYATTG